MPVLTCPHCATRMRVPDDLAPQKAVRCPRCQADVPRAPDAAPPPPPVNVELVADPAPGDGYDPTPPPMSPEKRVIVFSAVALLAYALGALTGWAAARAGKPADPPVAASAPAPPPAVPQHPAPEPTPAKIEPRHWVPPPETARPAPVADAPPEADERIGAEDLIKRFVGSTDGSVIAFKGKILEVPGRVVDIRRDERNAVIVQLGGLNPWRLVVKCKVTPSQAARAAKLMPGTEVVIRGRCDGYVPPTSGVPGDTIVDVLMGDCYLVK